jgi:hypothetical protein
MHFMCTALMILTLAKLDKTINFSSMILANLLSLLINTKHMQHAPICYPCLLISCLQETPNRNGVQTSGRNVYSRQNTTKDFQTKGVMCTHFLSTHLSKHVWVSLRPLPSGLISYHHTQRRMRACLQQYAVPLHPILLAKLKS